MEWEWEGVRIGPQEESPCGYRRKSWLTRQGGGANGGGTRVGGVDHARKHITKGSGDWSIWSGLVRLLKWVSSLLVSLGLGGMGKMRNTCSIAICMR